MTSGLFARYNHDDDYDTHNHGLDMTHPLFLELQRRELERYSRMRQPTSNSNSSSSHREDTTDTTRPTNMLRASSSSSSSTSTSSPTSSESSSSSSALRIPQHLFRFLHNATSHNHHHPQQPQQQHTSHTSPFIHAPTLLFTPPAIFTQPTSSSYQGRGPFRYHHHTSHSSNHRHGIIGGSVHPLYFVDRDFDERDYELLLQLDAQQPTKTVETSIIDKIPLVTVEESNCTCSICLDDLEVGSKASEIPICNHKFHPKCIETWLKDYGHTCPICKQPVSEIDFNALKENENPKKRKDIENIQETTTTATSQTRKKAKHRRR
ncbi:hypothetical protein C9374_002995 [Naegleria lovaniensis]|uniref:RING-type domain-containing protein n=1 Tax=Naegleria lovaniensis TaxID=51637 RepID=A0AA88GPC3_NAELO|nr:uncharacterized protein C9374_002995 [Naegleria lovaniensis]KAG2385846.1 hypothetical protein C9374_002995 [Naegleria lovaniensis]